jgi:transcriptional regulator with XRE-family HTH domain
VIILIINDLIKQERERVGISTRKLSEKIGKSSSYISSIENGLYKPDYDAVEQILKVLKVDTSILQQFDLERKNTKFNEEGLCINLPEDILEKLISLSINEFRTPEQQATKIIVDYMRAMKT